VVVTDGDTIKMGDIRFRLSGIDAPESRQLCEAKGTHYPCGKEATEALRGLVKGKVVWCRPTGAVSYRRKVASCSVDGADIGEWMVRQGWALAYRRFSKKYVPAEKEAQRERRGIWRGRFMKPWEWRRAKRLR
jgi:endonuclease YncB( thermonuclease family)